MMKLLVAFVLVLSVPSALGCVSVTDQPVSTGTELATAPLIAEIMINQTQTASLEGSFEIHVGGGRRYLQLVSDGNNDATFEATLNCVACGGQIFTQTSSLSWSIQEGNFGHLKVCAADNTGAQTCHTFSYSFSGQIAADDVTDRTVTYTRTCY